MSAPIIRFHYAGRSYPIELEPALAPRTIGLLIAALPAAVDLHCAKIAGQHIFWHAPFLSECESARDILSLPPGTFLYWPERQFLELIYGTLQAEKAQVSVLGRLSGDIGWLQALGGELAREHGQRIFRAELTADANTMHLGRPAAASPHPALRQLRSEREAVWRAEPSCIRHLLERKGTMLPYGPLAMAEGEFRKLHELLWRLRGDPAGSDGPDGMGRDSRAAFTALLLDAFVERIDGFCGLHRSGAVLTEAARLLREPQAPAAGIVDELVLYCGRMAAWLDLHIPWNALNEQVRAALSRQGF